MQVLSNEAKAKLKEDAKAQLKRQKKAVQKSKVGVNVKLCSLDMERNF